MVIQKITIFSLHSDVNAPDLLALQRPLEGHMEGLRSRKYYRLMDILIVQIHKKCCPPLQPLLVGPFTHHVVKNSIHAAFDIISYCLLYHFNMIFEVTETSSSVLTLLEQKWSAPENAAVLAI